jgi:hypothetical protein
MFDLCDFTLCDFPLEQNYRINEEYQHSLKKTVLSTV